MKDQIQPLVNRVANSGIVTINLETYFPSAPIVEFDLKNYLWKELILKEKDFRNALKEIDWTEYQDKICCIFNSADAIIPMWAYMLVSSHLTPYAKDTFVGSPQEYLVYHYKSVIDSLDTESYDDKRIVIKGCSNKPVPAAAYAEITSKLQPFTKSIMFGEPCSTVPIYKKKKA